MSTVLLSSMLSALSYINAQVGDSVNDMKNLYAQNKGTPEAYIWGSGHYPMGYLDEVKVVAVYHEDSSLDAYILADKNTKELHVVFRGTQELALDLYEGLLLALEEVGPQQEYVSTIFADAQEILLDLQAQDSGWNNPIQVTGHSLGGHLARTFSQYATAMSVPVETVVFNTPIPSADERGTQNDQLIYSDPSMWGWEGRTVHTHGLAESSTKTPDHLHQILIGAQDHGIVSIVNAIQGGVEAQSSQEYVEHYTQLMLSGGVVSSDFGSAAQFLYRVNENWSGRIPDILGMFRLQVQIQNAPYKVNLDDNYDQNGFVEEFTQVPTWGSVNRAISVNAGTLDDIAFLGLGNVTFDGGDGFDKISYKLSHSAVHITQEEVEITGISNGDLLYNIEKVEGSDFDDTFSTNIFGYVSGGLGDDTFNLSESDGFIAFYAGGADDDIFSVSGEPISATIDGGEGVDFLDASQATGATRFTEADPTLPLGQQPQNTLRSVEVILGGAYDDEFVFTDASAPTDIRVIQGGFGTDTIYLSEGGSSATAGAREVNLLQGTYGYATSLNSIENVIGAGDGDHVRGNNGTNIIATFGGDDVVYGEGGIDLIYGGDQNDELWGGVGNDSLYGEADNDHLYGEDGSDRLDGGGGDDHLYGGLNNDTLFGGTGQDFLYGEGGNDSLRGGDNTDYLEGGIGNDTLRGEGGEDVLFGGTGTNYLYGGADSDTFIFGFGVGTDYVMDFELTVDRLVNQDFVNPSYFQVGLYVVIQGYEGLMYLANTQLADVQAADQNGLLWA